MGDIIGIIMIIIGIILFAAGQGSIALVFTFIPAVIFFVGGLIVLGVSSSKKSSKEETTQNEQQLDDANPYPGFISEAAQTENDDKSIVVRYDPAQDRDVHDEIKNALERAFLALNYFQFDEAAVHFDRVLDMDPHFAPAYMGKLLCSLGIRDERNLPFTRATFTKDHNWDLALRFATEEELVRYNGYLEQAREEREKYNQQKEAEEAERNQSKKGK